MFAWLLVGLQFYLRKATPSLRFPPYSYKDTHLIEFLISACNPYPVFYRLNVSGNRSFEEKSFICLDFHMQKRQKKKEKNPLQQIFANIGEHVLLHPIVLIQPEACKGRRSKQYPSWALEYWLSNMDVRVEGFWRQGDFDLRLTGWPWDHMFFEVTWLSNSRS